MADREALRALIKQKDEMEKEILELSEALSSSNMGGVAGPLVDAEGFPRADVDVHATRTMRNRLAILNTDHKAIMARIEQGLTTVLGAPEPSHPTGGGGGGAGGRGAAADITDFSSHGYSRGAASTGATVPAVAPATGPSPMEIIEDDESELAALQPYAEIDEVAEGGPAASAGVQVGDLLLRFGSLDATNHDGLRALARLTQRSVGDAVPLVLLRDGARVRLSLQPRRWAGNGLLGCHLKPM